MPPPPTASPAPTAPAGPAPSYLSKLTPIATPSYEAKLKPIAPAAPTAPAPQDNALSKIVGAGKAVVGALNENPVAKGVRSLAALPTQGLAAVLGQPDPFQKGIGGGKAPVSVTTTNQPLSKLAEEEAGNALTVGSLFIPGGAISKGAAKLVPALGKLAAPVARVATNAASGAIQGTGGGLQDKQNAGDVVKSAGIGSLISGGLSVAGELGGALVENASKTTGESRITAQKDALKSLHTAFDNTSTKATNPIKTMEQTGLTKHLKVVDSKINIDGITNSERNGVLDGLINEQQTMGTQAVAQMKGAIPTRDFKNAVVEQIKASPSLKASGNVSKMLAEVGHRFDDYTGSYGDSIPFKDINQIRVAMNKAWNPDTWDAEKAIGSAARSLLYDSKGAGAALKSAMANEQELINAKEFVQKLGGTAVRGGRLGKYFMDTIGAGIGAGMGATLGPVGVGLGGAVGALATDKGADLIRSRTFNPLLTKPAQAVAKTIPAIGAATKLGKAIGIPALVKQ